MKPQVKHRQPAGVSRITSLAKELRATAKIIRNASVPDKGEVDVVTGATFNGFTRQKIADNAIGKDEADSQFLDTKHYAIIAGDRRLTPGVKFALDDAIGSLDVNNLGGGGQGHTISPSLLPGIGTMSGTLDVNNLGGGGAGHTIDKNLIPGIGALNGTLDVANLGGGGAGHVIDKDLVPKIENLRGTLSYSALSNKPNLSRFLTDKDMANRATHHWVKAYVDKHVKPTARR